MSQSRPVVGIDVSKAWLDGVVLPAGTAWRVPNSPAGWRQVIATSAGTPPPLIVLEATGPYHQGVTVALDAAGLTPAVINPLKIRRFVQSQGHRAKTDTADARTLAQYGQQLQPRPRPLPPAATRDLQALVSRRVALTGHLVMEKNRLQMATIAPIKASAERMIALITTERGLIEAEIARRTASDRALQQRTTLLRSAPGIGVVLAPTLVAGVPELGQRTAKELAALVGLAPYARDSGAHQGQRYIVGGRAALRRALYQAATTSVRCNPVLRAHYQQLIARGKAHKVALIACARRLLGILNAMVRDDLTWDQTQVGQGQFLATTP